MAQVAGPQGPEQHLADAAAAAFGAIQLERQLKTVVDRPARWRQIGCQVKANQQ